MSIRNVIKLNGINTIQSGTLFEVEGGALLNPYMFSPEPISGLITFLH